MKKRVLFCGEASPLNTGFSTYYRELLPRLARTGKYEIGEMGSYMRSDDPRAHEFIKNQWRFWGVEPTSQEEQAEYQNPANQSPRCPGQNTWQFGDGKFPHVCAEFQPDIVTEIRDWWMLEYIERSPFRPYFKWLAMPTVDSEPQKEEWANTYATADMCLAYSDYGVHTLKQYPGIKVYTEPMRPGVDLQTFAPMDKAELKKDWLGCKEDVKVILMIARNQSRKLYPDALDAFALLKERYKGNPSIDKAVLVIHSSWPDNQFSYDYPRHINRISTGYHGLQYYYPKMRDDVFQTLICHDCGHVSMTWAINLFGKQVVNGDRGPKIYVSCQKCGKQTATTPDTSTGYTREQLAQLYNVADAFIQVSIAEGCGMPVQEAKSCGVPTLVTDYSATAEKGRFPAEYQHLKGVKSEEYTVSKGGIAIPVGRYYYEPETSCRRAHPDVSVLADQLYQLLTDDADREKMSIEARECAEENYDWDKLAKRWEYVLDNVKIKDRSTTWDKPHEILTSTDEVQVPDGLSDSALIDFLYINILKYPRVDDAGKEQWLASMQAGQTREKIIQSFRSIANSAVNESNQVNELLAKPEDTKDELGGEFI